ncbi:MAG: DUF1361 domain-containing protein [Anaerolineae bacterium]|nr:DUF1361 domain-containing protein [Anaerolineae bacterium]
MSKTLKAVKNTYSFLHGHAFYPMTLASLLGFGMFAARVLKSDTLHFINLPWNLFLAWVPYLCSLWVASIHARHPRRWWALLVPGALWLLFFPNAPYIVTDFLHLVPRYGIPIWYDILMLATFAWTGIFLGFASLRAMQNIAVDYFGAFFSWLFVAGSLALGGLGIYLGRFSRWNSWDILSHPKSILKDIAIRFLDPFSNKQFYGFTLMVTAFLLVGYLTFTSVQGLNKPHTKRR